MGAADNRRYGVDSGIARGGAMGAADNRRYDVDSGVARGGQ